MKKLAFTLLFCLFPVLVFADSSGSLSFAPPTTDKSVVFLGNLFGIVDGVLSGTGSQIMGSMFGVFNAAVLGLGGIIIMYTLMVSTMNTAHEGQMLGQKWSSIWIPVRSTMGLALLVPKASGYCMMQIFVMWVIIQGVGAADKVWTAALSYLNRGGVIVQGQMDTAAISNLTDSINALTGNSGADNGPAPILKAASVILSGQVCMLGLQNQLNSIRQSYLNAKGTKGSPCYAENGTVPEPMAGLCNNAVPDLMSTFNAVDFQSNSSGDTFTLEMPYFKPTDTAATAYHFLHGICGSVTWKSISGSSSFSNITTLNSSELDTAKLSRAIAIQQMFVNLSSVAQVMVNNDPLLNNQTSTVGAAGTASSTDNNYSANAVEQFGVPYKPGGQLCSKYDDGCTSWGPAPVTGSSSNANSVIFTGTEFLLAFQAYNGVMAPTLKLISDAADAANSNKAREFIATSESEGWITAGAYFFDLVKLNGNALSNSSTMDSGTGLGGSSYSATSLTSAFPGQGSNSRCDPNAPFANLCSWFQNDPTKLTNVVNLITGGVSASLPTPTYPPSTTLTADTNKPTSSSVYSFINNSTLLKSGTQSGIQALTFANKINFSVDTSLYYLQYQDFDCGRVKIMFFSFCLGKMMGDVVYNYILRYVYNLFLAIFGQIINAVVMAFLMVPLQGMAGIFTQGIGVLSQPGVNPIVALANMGTMYINFSANLWLSLLTMAIASAILFPFGIFIFALMAFAFPLLLAWVGTMVSIGFVTAYYVPTLPYMIFTFGALAWMIAVIEAMVAAPIVALGVTHPEGHDAFGKGEAAIMILINVFLRPSLMIIGYISGIALSYVGVWLLNAGFDHAISFMQSATGGESGGWGDWKTDTSQWDNFSVTGTSNYQKNYSDSTSINYSDWAGIYAFFFSIIIYTSMYLVMVQKAFTLIAILPDRVLRWIGGTEERLGQETAQWGEEAKGKVQEGAKATKDSEGQVSKAIGGRAVEMAKKMAGSDMTGSGDVEASASKSSGKDGGDKLGGTSTPSAPPGGAPK
jgi:defect-in-organelle-trafficking protein DotA